MEGKIGKILVVDDDENISEVLKMYLQSSGYDIRVAADGKAAQEVFVDYKPDLVLLDIMLPDVSGYQIVQELRADPGLRDVRVLMMTARGSIIERKKGLALGADGFLAKPFELSELRSEIARLLGPPC